MKIDKLTDEEQEIVFLIILKENKADKMIRKLDQKKRLEILAAASEYLLNPPDYE